MTAEERVKSCKAEIEAIAIKVGEAIHGHRIMDGLLALLLNTASVLEDIRKANPPHTVDNNLLQLEAIINMHIQGGVSALEMCAVLHKERRENGKAN